MLKPWAETIKDIIYMTGSLGTIVTIVRTQVQKNKALKAKERESRNWDTDEKKNKSQTKKSEQIAPLRKVFEFLRAYKYSIIIFLSSVILIVLLNRLGRVETSPPSDQESVSIIPTPKIVTSVPIKSSVKDAWLDELDPILHKPRAFFIHEWSRYDLIQIEDTIYQHSIGICIPSDKLKAYCDIPPVGEILHNEYLEYRLSYKYKSFQFDYGIDDISFPEDVETASRCEYKIVVQSCNSKEYLGSTDNILYDSDWINYRSTVFRSTLIDVANSEAIRITVYWKFHLRTCGPIAFNIAIVNPILRGIKADTYISNPKRSQTKPDSIR